jgi:DNA-binding Lrp family transcriptional regulator
MARAYLRVWVESGREDAVRNELKRLNGVTSADLTAGDQDLMVIVEADSYEDIVQIVLGQIRVLKGVSKTITSLAVR